MYKFILIDDEYAITEYFRQLINWNEIGYECAGNFATGKDAIEFIKHNHIDLVVTDIVMPDMDGLEVSRWIYENCPSVTVVFLSAHDDISYAKEAMKYMDNTQDYDYETRTVVGTMKDNNSYTAQYMLYGGKVAQKMSNSVKLTRDSQALIRPYIQYDFLLFTKTTFLEYTVSRGKLVLNRGLMNNIYIGDDMAYTSINGQPRTVFLIK